MEMTTTSGVGGVTTTKLDDDDNDDDDYPLVVSSSSAAAAAPLERWWWPGIKKKKKKTCRRVLLVGSLVTLLLLAFFVFTRENASMAWLQTAISKLTATNDDGDDAPRGHVDGDELLGGLLPPGMDRRSCRSRYESWRYYKHFPFTPSPYLLAKLRAYEARHRRCAPGTPLYAAAVEQLRSGNSSAAGAAEEECRYVVWLPFDGLGNRMLSMVSGFLYALLTGRVLLAALPPDSADLFCEPFPNTTWRLPVKDFPVANLFGLSQDMDRSYWRLVKAAAGGDANNATAAAAGTPPPPPAPAYVYLSLGWLLRDGVFFCGEHQRALRSVDWLLLYSDLYFAPSLYGVAEFRGELRRLFPEKKKESVHHLLSRYLLHPTNPVWSMVTAYYRSRLAPATRRIGLQVRMFGFASVPADDLYNQILNCSKQEHILPGDEAADATAPAIIAAGDGNNVTGSGSGSGSDDNSTTAIFIASLYGKYYKRLRSRYYGTPAAAKGRVGVFQRTKEGRQATGNLGHNQRALAEIYLLSFCDELLTSGLSTFGYVSSSLAGVRPAILLTAFDHKVPETPCRRAASVEPCNLTPPRGVECRDKPTTTVDEEDDDDMARHVKVCEDFKNGVKFFD